jgi:hypothetical protein
MQPWGSLKEERRSLWLRKLSVKVLNDQQAISENILCFNQIIIFNRFIQGRVFERLCLSFLIPYLVSSPLDQKCTMSALNLASRLPFKRYWLGFVIIYPKPVISAMYLVLRSSFGGCDIIFSIRANQFDKVCSFDFYDICKKVRVDSGC